MEFWVKQLIFSTLICHCQLLHLFIVRPLWLKTIASLQFWDSNLLLIGSFFGFPTDRKINKWKKYSLTNWKNSTVPSAQHPPALGQAKSITPDTEVNQLWYFNPELKLIMLRFSYHQICQPQEKTSIDRIIDAGPLMAGEMDYRCIHSEYHCQRAQHLKQLDAYLLNTLRFHRIQCIFVI